MGIVWEAYHKGVPCPWRSLKIPLTKPLRMGNGCFTIHPFKNWLLGVPIFFGSSLQRVVENGLQPENTNQTGRQQTHPTVTKPVF